MKNQSPPFLLLQLPFLATTQTSIGIRATLHGKKMAFFVEPDLTTSFDVKEEVQ